MKTSNVYHLVHIRTANRVEQAVPVKGSVESWYKGMRKSPEFVEITGAQRVTEGAYNLAMRVGGVA